MPGVTDYLIATGAPVRAELTPRFHCRFAISAHMSAVDSLLPRSEMTERDAGVLRIVPPRHAISPARRGAAADGQVHIQHDIPERRRRTGWRQNQSSCSAAAAVGARVKERTPNVPRCQTLLPVTRIYDHHCALPLRG